ncbi:sensor histidine kinase [Thermomonas carbonis]|uniref:Sensor histidine kinase n=1 Tax=Thermomonas carbonis TaxID=1463158 RepID=A0A7G9STT1_9GAMM|nr:sensor histidine kinase [Thermomonas carbonis]QNN71256.1 sensor histidine kinase [Thermomonas carbonis]GHC10851.1 two-component sensor histidine kinase [Thermomonas carbonis]
MKRLSQLRWLQPAPDSVAAQELRLGRSPWTNFIHLVWSVWVFLTPALSGGEYGFSWQWLWLTLLSYPLFLWAYVTSVFAAPRRAHLAALAMVAICLALLPWYPSGLSYFVFGCVMLQPRRSRSILRYLGTIAVLNVVLISYARYIGYPWQALVWMPTVTAIIGVIVMVERINREREVALKLSHDEVRRLAALAERERIGRDLHDLLGHTLSMVALKSDLAGRLLDRDPAAARNEIGEVSRVAREALAQVRRAVTGIRAAGIAAELAAAKLLLETDGVSFDYRFDDGFAGNALPPGVESALAMTVREAATNIQRHARAQRAEASFGMDGGDAVLRIVDDGRGGAIVPGNGLVGMRERLEGVHGSLRIDAGPGRGTRVEARVPLAANDDPIDDGIFDDGRIDEAS